MKKSIIIIAALCAATFVSAQITLEKTFENGLKVGTVMQIIQPTCSITSAGYMGPVSGPFPFVVGPYIIETYPDASWNNIFYDIYDFKTYTLLKTFTDKELAPDGVYQYGCLSRGLFTTDDRWAWAYIKDNELFIVTEDHTELLHTAFKNSPYLIKVDDQYKLIVFVDTGSSSTVTQIYSLPGKGDSGQDISTPVAPRNSRKVLKKDQVLVENADKTYTLQGQEIK